MILTHLWIDLPVRRGNEDRRLVVAAERAQDALLHGEVEVVVVDEAAVEAREEGAPDKGIKLLK